MCDLHHPSRRSSRKQHQRLIDSTFDDQDSGSIMDQTLICEDSNTVVSDLTDEAMLYNNRRWTMEGAHKILPPHQHFRRQKLQPYPGGGSRGMMMQQQPPPSSSAPMPPPLTSSPLTMGQRTRGMEARRVELPPVLPPPETATTSMNSTTPRTMNRRQPEDALPVLPPDQHHLTMPPQQQEAPPPPEAEAPKMPRRRQSGNRLEIPKHSFASLASSNFSSSGASSASSSVDELTVLHQDGWTLQEDDDDDDESTILSRDIHWTPPRAQENNHSNHSVEHRSPDNSEHTGESTLITTNHHQNAGSSHDQSATTTLSSTQLLQQQQQPEDPTTTTQRQRPPLSQYPSPSEMPPDISESTDDATAGGWVCECCTYHNTNMEFLSCEVCGLVRMMDQPSPKNDNPSIQRADSFEQNRFPSLHSIPELDHDDYYLEDNSPSSRKGVDRNSTDPPNQDSTLLAMQRRHEQELQWEEQLIRDRFNEILELQAIEEAKQQQLEKMQENGSTTGSSSRTTALRL